MGFCVRLAQLPEGADNQNLDSLAAALRARVAEVAGYSDQQVLRLLMGCNLDATIAAGRARDVAAWRQQRGMAQMREQLLAQARATGPFHLPEEGEVCKLIAVNPCALVTKDGCPVSIWHVGTANSKAVGKVADESLLTWSCAVFEYADVWISEQSEQTGQLAGHVQVFNLQDLGIWQVSSRALLDKLKKALSAGEYYLEAVSHIYVVNSSSLFSMAWKIIRGLISPRTASKITVANDVPQEFLAILDPSSAKRLPGLLSRQQLAGVMRPPLASITA